jgi:N-acetylglucosaminyldiphosphoundecaprenol N-acetyl-beta-D-mannosaminyltransferase
MKTEAKKQIFPRVHVAGCPVDALAFENAVEELCYRIEKRIRTHVVFVNAAKVVRYRNDGALRAALDRADLLLADGVPVVWASRLSHQPLPGRVNGTDLLERMISVAAERGYRVFFLGARVDVLQQAVAACRRVAPKLIVAGTQDGYFKDSTEVVRRIAQSKADMLFVGMTTPEKEIWGDAHLSQVGVCVCQGVGGSFDVLAGKLPRAPRWMQKAGLEWFFRFLQEPRRMWRRYLTTNSAFIWLVLKTCVQGNGDVTTLREGALEQEVHDRAA